MIEISNGNEDWGKKVKSIMKEKYNKLSLPSIQQSNHSAI